MRGNKLFKSGKFLMTTAAATLISITPILSGLVAEAETVDWSGHSISDWQANDVDTVAAALKSQGITSINDLADYKVQWGDTLSVIAQYFGTTVTNVAQQFGIQNPDLIVTGVKVHDQQEFQLFWGITVSQTLSSKNPINNTILSKNYVDYDDVSPNSSSSTANQADNTNTQISTNTSANSLEDYTVQTGDSVDSIAKKFGTTSDNVKQKFGLNDSGLLVVNIAMKNQANFIQYIGDATAQRLSSTLTGKQSTVEQDMIEGITTIFADETVYKYEQQGYSFADAVSLLNKNWTSLSQAVGIDAANPFVTDNVGVNPSIRNSSNLLNYQVEQGDTVESIAAKFHTSVAYIQNTFNVTDSNLSVGVVLGGKLSDSEVNEITDPSTYLSPVAKYQVQWGDTIQSVASKFNTTVANLETTFGLNSDTLVTGWTMRTQGLFQSQFGSTITNYLSSTYQSNNTQAAADYRAKVRSANAQYEFEDNTGYGGFSGFDASTLTYYSYGVLTKDQLNTTMDANNDYGTSIVPARFYDSLHGDVKHYVVTDPNVRYYLPENAPTQQSGTSETGTGTGNGGSTTTGNTPGASATPSNTASGSQQTAGTNSEPAATSSSSNK